MSLYSGNYKQHNYIIFSILFGILGFSLTYFIIFYFATPNYEFHTSCENAKLATSTYHFEQDSIDLVKTTYYKDVNNFTSITPVKATICENESGWFYMKSEFTPAYLYKSKDRKKLHHTISTLDFKYAQKLGRKNISPPHFFNKFPKAALWIILISIATGYSFFLIPIFLAGIRKYGIGLSVKVKKRNIIFSVLIITILILAQFLPNVLSSFIMLFAPSQVLAIFGFGYEPWTLYFASTASFVSIIVWIVLIFTINAKLTLLHETNNATFLKDFKTIRKDVELYFIIIGIFLAFTIFCTDTLLRASDSFTGAESSIFPSEFAFMNGLVQTFFLILIYSAIRTNFIRIQQAIDNDEKISATAKEELTEDKSFLNYLKVILTMLAPLIGSGLQEFIGLIVGG